MKIIPISQQTLSSKRKVKKISSYCGVKSIETWGWKLTFKYNVVHSMPSMLLCVVPDGAGAAKGWAGQAGCSGVCQSQREPEENVVCWQRGKASLTSGPSPARTIAFMHARINTRTVWRHLDKDQMRTSDDVLLSLLPSDVVDGHVVWESMPSSNTVTRWRMLSRAGWRGLEEAFCWRTCRTTRRHCSVL